MKAPRTIPQLREIERALVAAALEEHEWNLRRAAAGLDVTASSLQSLVRKHKIERPGNAPEHRGRPRSG